MSSAKQLFYCSLKNTGLERVHCIVYWMQGLILQVYTTEQHNLYKTIYIVYLYKMTCIVAASLNTRIQ